MYILGMKFAIETDHKPLIPLLGSKQLDSLPPRVLRFRLHLARFDYTITHVPGKLLYTADTSSRAPSASTYNDSRLEQEAEMVMELHVSQLPASPQTCNDYLKAQAEDSVCKTVIEHCKTGWPDRNEEISPELKPYQKAQGELTVNKHGLLLFQKRIIVPKSLLRRTLEKMSHEIENMVQQCHTCAQNANPRK